MTPMAGGDGQKTEPEYMPQVNCAAQAGQFLDFTDGSRRMITKVESTYHSDSNRVMVTTTILFEENEIRWQKSHSPF